MINRNIIVLRSFVISWVKWVDAVCSHYRLFKDDNLYPPLSICIPCSRPLMNAAWWTWSWWRIAAWIDSARSTHSMLSGHKCATGFIKSCEGRDYSSTIEIFFDLQPTSNCIQVNACIFHSLIACNRSYSSEEIKVKIPQTTNVDWECRKQF